MRIVIDLQGAQTESRLRGIGRYSLALAKAIVCHRKDHEILIALNGLLPDTIEPIRAAFDGILPQENIRVWYVPGPVQEHEPGNDERRKAAELIREAFIASLNPDVIHVTSLFEGYIDNAVTSIKTFDYTTPVSVSFYDLIPLLDPDSYLKPNPVYESHYLRKISHLKRADLLLGISQSATQEGIDHLHFKKDRCVNVSTAADPMFKPISIDSKSKAEIFKRYNLQHDFVMYTGGVDSRKNIDGLIKSYAALPKAVREKHQLLLVCNPQSSERNSFEEIAHKAGLKRDEYIFTGHVSDDDLVALYNLCKVFVVLSSDSASFLIGLEAMSCGGAVIGSSTSRCLEDILLKEALFDPKVEKDIAAKLKKVLTDEIFRKRLEVHGLKLAKNFSWDVSGKSAILAFEKLHAEKQKESQGVLSPSARPRLAFVSPLPPERNVTNDYSAELISELDKYYDIDVIVNQDEISDPWVKANCPIRSVEWFRNHHYLYDRVLYHFGNSPLYRHMFDLLEEIPGVVVLHDFNLSHLAEYMGDHHIGSVNFLGELYYSNGYNALEEGILDAHLALKTYPCNRRVLGMSLGVLYLRNRKLKNDREELTYNLYEVVESAGASTDLSLENNLKLCGDNLSFSKLAQLYKKSIENFYNKFDVSTLLSRIKDTDLSQDDYVEMLTSVSGSFRKKFTQKQIFLDISDLVTRDYKSGIQRVVRSLLRELLMNTPEGMRIEPVYAKLDSGYFYAREFMLNLYDCSQDVLADEPIEYQSGDIFLGLDLFQYLVWTKQDFYQKMRRHGVEVYFLIYDLLPILLPRHFPQNFEEAHVNWLSVIAESDGVVCISKSVADEFEEWMDKNGPKRLRPLKISWFHLGADIENSIPSKGMPEDAWYQLRAINEKINFLMVGTIEPRKGHRQTLKAFENLWSQGIDVSLSIVGKHGWLMDEFVEYLHNHKELGRRLFLFEGVSDEYLEKIYGVSKCLISASEGEGFGLPLIEAAQRKISIITRDIPVFKEVVGKYGYYFSGLKPEDLSVRIEEWLKLYKENKHPKSDNMPWLTWQESAQNLLKIIHPSSPSGKKGDKKDENRKNTIDFSSKKNSLVYSDREKKNRFVIDVTTLIKWNRPPVGIIRNLFEVTHWFYQKSNVEDVAFVKFSDDKSQIIFLSPEEISSVLNKYEGARAQAEKIKHKGSCVVNESPSLFSKVSSFFSLQNKDVLEENHFVTEKSGHDHSGKENASRLSYGEHETLREGDIFFSLGLDWEYSNYKLLYFLKKSKNFKFMGIVYDLIPILYPQYTVAADLPSRFFSNLYYMNYLADGIMCISDYSKNSLLNFRLQHSVLKKTQVKTIHIGDAINACADDLDDTIIRTLPEQFILYVSTIEARKNHLVLMKAYILAHTKGIDLPPLILVGMNGWGVDEYHRLYAENEFLKDKIISLSNVDDSILDYLYKNTLFCVFPSEVEGWGLGAAEALLHGKLCLISEAAALKEATRGLVPVVSTHDEHKWMLAINHYASNSNELINMENQIKAKFVPKTWSSFCQDLYNFAKEVS